MARPAGDVAAVIADMKARGTARGPTLPFGYRADVVLFARHVLPLIDHAPLR